MDFGWDLFTARLEGRRGNLSGRQWGSLACMSLCQPLLFCLLLAATSCESMRKRDDKRGNIVIPSASWPFYLLSPLPPSSPALPCPFINSMEMWRGVTAWPLLVLSFSLSLHMPCAFRLCPSGCLPSLLMSVHQSQYGNQCHYHVMHQKTCSTVFIWRLSSAFIYVALHDLFSIMYISICYETVWCECLVFWPFLSFSIPSISSSPSILSVPFPCGPYHFIFSTSVLLFLLAAIFLGSFWAPSNK